MKKYVAMIPIPCATNVLATKLLASVQGTDLGFLAKNWFFVTVSAILRNYPLKLSKSLIYSRKRKFYTL